MKNHKMMALLFLLKNYLLSTDPFYIYIYGQIGASRIYIQHINFQISQQLLFKLLFLENCPVCFVLTTVERGPKLSHQILYDRLENW